jgi:ubiquinone/menaquinone biosynthesis C-methylase UbiE
MRVCGRKRSCALDKTFTDLHWNERAASVAEDVEVNLMDIFQREIEYDYVAAYLEPGMRVLEVGCGNGYSTNRFRDLVAYVDAFDFAENMIDRARRSFGESNNRFIHDNVLAPRHLDGPYDTVLCIRVLINLRDLDQQLLALRNMAALTKAGGLLVLAEGFTEGFLELNELRRKVGLPPLTPAPINFYSSIDDLSGTLDEYFELVEKFHLGAYDYLTRVLYPLIVGPENATHNSNFSERCSMLARSFNPDSFEPLSRMRGLVLRRRG